MEGGAALVNVNGCPNCSWGFMERIVLALPVSVGEVCHPRIEVVHG
jgi:hypothetical protein